MRTTLTLDPDVAQLIQDAVRQQHRSIKQVVNDALRQALGAHAQTPTKPYLLVPHSAALLPDIDSTSLNHLADELETDVALRKLTLSK